MWSLFIDRLGRSFIRTNDRRTSQTSLASYPFDIDDNTIPQFCVIGDDFIVCVVEKRWQVLDEKGFRWIRLLTLFFNLLNALREIQSTKQNLVLKFADRSQIEVPLTCHPPLSIANRPEGFSANKQKINYGFLSDSWMIKCLPRRRRKFLKSCGKMSSLSCQRLGSCLELLKNFQSSSTIRKFMYHDMRSKIFPFHSLGRSLSRLVRSQIFNYVEREGKSDATQLKKSLLWEEETLWQGCWLSSKDENMKRNFLHSGLLIFCSVPSVITDLPDPVTNCTAYNATAYTMQFTCSPGHDGGIKQSFFVEVINSEKLFS